MAGPDLHRYRPQLIESCVVLALSLAAALWYARVADHPLLWDEYYHLLAARSWAESGTLAVGDGLYDRATWFTVLVGRLFRAFGESLFVARLPGALTLGLWTVAIFVPLRLWVGGPAAWVAAFLFCLSPLVLVNTVMVRFYGPAGLLYWLGCLAAFAAATGRRSWVRRVVLAAAGLLSLNLCFRVTNLARLWIACLGVWLVGLAVVRGLRSERRWLFLGVTAAIGAVAAAWAFGSGWIQPLWAYYRDTPAWGLDRGLDLRWYERLLRDDYPTLWTLLPVAVTVAALRDLKLAALGSVAFLSGLLLLSFGGPKAERYIVPLLPFFFVVWGIATAALIPAIRDRITLLVSRLAEAGGPRRVWWIAGHALLGIVLVFVLVTNPGFTRVRSLLLRGRVTSADRLAQGAAASPAAWDEVGARLGAALEEADVVITPNSVQALYHLGGYDVAFQPWVLDLLDPPRELGVDARTGLPVISTLGSLARLVAENERGLLFGERWRWRNPSAGFTEDVADYVEANMEPVPLPPGLGVLAYRW